MVRPNIGIVNALIRITCGLALLSFSTAKYCKKPWRDSYIFVMILAAMKVGEGIVRFCPITYLFEQNDTYFFEDDEDDFDEDDIEVTYNPS
ncbi:YgaP family membrane protein [Bacillus weihaiensis]|uniref:Inner membrane protein YgaP-like transmembrane domain-containing protein n=1 Tax=Bacillus weihaiensis TaxID=1547283 RepID=A0A1L3MVX4_9BACI|nr:DUF2892 domain-containing protein [Bacillus weihaiensis]APH06487.1 hypothetical protein A9C19_18075 [Bacillus weihaiensis]